MASFAGNWRKQVICRSRTNNADSIIIPKRESAAMTCLHTPVMVMTRPHAMGGLWILCRKGKPAPRLESMMGRWRGLDWWGKRRALGPHLSLDVRSLFTGEDVMELADQLIDRLIRQRNICLEAFIQRIDSSVLELGVKFPFDFKPGKKEAIEIISAFQVVHVLSFVNMKSYVDYTLAADFTKYVCANLFEGDHEICIGYVNRYTELKKQDPSEQWTAFSEDVAVAIVGGPSGTVIGPSLSLIAKEFTYRLWGITADTFKDSDAVSEISNILSDMHKK